MYCKQTDRKVQKSPKEYYTILLDDYTIAQELLSFMTCLSSWIKPVRKRLPVTLMVYMIGKIRCILSSWKSNKAI